MATRPADTTRRDGGDPSGPRRILVVANEVIGGEQLVEEIARHAGRGGQPEVKIVSPALVGSALDLAAGDVDDDIAEARRRLERSAEALRGRGIRATGDVGEADPVLAIRDALVGFPAAEVIIVTHPSERATWLEKDLLERARRQVSVPITHIEVEADGGATASVRDVREVSSARNEAAANRSQAEFETDYLPPMSRRDRFALALGPLGTIALWLLAADCQGQIPHDFGGDAACIALVILAIFALVLTAIHVPMLLLLRAGNYRGGLADFVAKAILYYIPAALVAGVVLALIA
jgi:hypothetical protein